MAFCESTDLYKGQGVVYIRPQGTTTEAWTHLGDSTAFSISETVTYVDAYESCSGNRSQIEHVVQQRDYAVTLTSRSFNKKVLARVLNGTASAVTGASIVDEPIALTNIGDYAITAHPGISAVVVERGASALVLNTDYEVDGPTGVIKLLTTGVGAVVVSYTYAAYDKVAAATASSNVYELMFVGTNTASAGGTHKVIVPKATLDLNGEIAWIGEDFAELTMEGAVLLISGQSPYTWTKSA